MFSYRVEKVLRVIDGDTVELLVDLGFHTFTKQKVRLRGIDAPEIRGPEKEKGLKAKQFLEELLNKEEIESIYVETVKDKQGKFGRYVCTLFLKLETQSTEIIVNTELVINNHAKWRSYREN